MSLAFKDMRTVRMKMVANTAEQFSRESDTMCRMWTSKPSATEMPGSPQHASVTVATWELVPEKGRQGIVSLLVNCSQPAL